MARRSRELPRQVTALGRRIETWRRVGAGQAMPAEYWSAAVSLAREHGVCPISRALGIDYKGLRRRLTGGAPVPRARRRRRGGFVELGPGALAGMMVGHDGSERVGAIELELCGRDGSRLLIRLPRGAAMEVPALAASVWRNR